MDWLVATELSDALRKPPCVYSAFVTYRLIDWFSSVLPIALFSSLSLCVLTPALAYSPSIHTNICVSVFLCVCVLCLS